MFSKDILKNKKQKWRKSHISNYTQLLNLLLLLVDIYLLFICIIIIVIVSAICKETQLAHTCAGALGVAIELKLKQKLKLNFQIINSANSRSVAAGAADWRIWNTLTRTHTHTHGQTHSHARTHATQRTTMKLRREQQKTKRERMPGASTKYKAHRAKAKVIKFYCVSSSSGVVWEECGMKHTVR